MVVTLAGQGDPALALEILAPACSGIPTAASSLNSGKRFWSG